MREATNWPFYLVSGKLKINKTQQRKVMAQNMQEGTTGNLYKQQESQTAPKNQRKFGPVSLDRIEK